MRYRNFYAHSSEAESTRGQCIPNKTSLADPRSVSVVLMAVSVWPHLGPGGVPRQGKGRGLGAGKGSAASGSIAGRSKTQRCLSSPLLSFQANSPLTQV